MGKKLFNGKLLLLATSLLLFGVGKAESKETTKLDETFAHFLDEQKNLAAEEAKLEMDAKNVVSSEETAMKQKEAASMEQKSSQAIAQPASDEATATPAAYKDKKSEAAKEADKKKKEEEKKQEKKTSPVRKK